MKRNILIIIASIAICATLLIGCGGGGGGGGGNPSSPTKTGTLQGTVSLPASSLRFNIEKSASNTSNIASNTIEQEKALRASQSLEGTKVWLEGYPEINGTTDKDGKYILPNVPFGKNRVVANIKIGKEEYKWRSEIQNVTNTTIIIVPQIVLQPAKTSISGTVYDAVSKKTIQGVIVEVWGQRSTSGADGKYTVYNMPAGSWEVTYSKNGYQTFTSPMSFADGIETSGNFYLVPEGNKDPSIASYSGSVALTELVPAYKATNVSNQTTISAFFNGAKINTNYAVIKFTSGNPKKVKGKFSFVNDKVIYTHNESWPVNTIISGEIGGLKDYFGKDIASFSFEFTTSANVVKSIVPANNSTNIEVDTPIEIAFNSKVNQTLDFTTLISITDSDKKSLTIKKEQLSWSTNSDGNDVLKITSLPFEVEKQYKINLSEKIQDNSGNPLDGQKEFTFSTRGAILLTYEPATVCHALSDIKFKINGGTISDVSKAKVILSCNNVSGKLNVEGDYLVYKLNTGFQWPFGTDVTISINNLTDCYNSIIEECKANFYIQPQTEISFSNSSYKGNLRENLIFVSKNKTITNWNISNSLITFDNTSVNGIFSLENNQIIFKLNEGCNYPSSTKITGKLTGLIDENNLPVKDCNFEFNTREAVEIYELNFSSNSDRVVRDAYMIFSLKGDIQYPLDLSEAKILIDGNSINGDLSVIEDSDEIKFIPKLLWSKYSSVNGKIVGIKDNEGLAVEEYDFSFNTDYFAGEGTINNPYLVSNADDLNDVRNKGDSYYFKQTTNIDLSDYSNGTGWLPINGNGFFYNGNGYKVSNLYINRPNDTVGLFGSINGSIKDLGIENVSITCSNGGALVGSLCDSSYSSGGNLTNIISNCWVNSGKIIASNKCGGLFGGVYANSIRNCFSNIDIELKKGNHLSSVGGFSGSIIANEVKNCYSLGSINYKADNVLAIGGFSGYITGSCFSCFSNVNITVNINAENEDYWHWCTIGGFTAIYSSGNKISNCYSKGQINGQIIKQKNNYYESEILSGNYVLGIGSFIGRINDTLSVINSYSVGNISLDLSGYWYVGGFIGQISGPWSISLRNDYSDCSEVITSYKGNRILGGVGSKSGFSISNCYANKNMTLTVDGVPKTPGLQVPLPETVALDREDGANLPENVDWKTQIFKDGYENGESFDSVWEIGTSGLPILKNMPGNPAQ